MVLDHLETWGLRGGKERRHSTLPVSRIRLFPGLSTRPNPPEPARYWNRWNAPFFSPAVALRRRRCNDHSGVGHLPNVFSFLKKEPDLTILTSHPPARNDFIAFEKNSGLSDANST
jgi:hypothetical protein